MSDDKTILDRINDLVAEEHVLRRKHSSGEVSDTDEHQRLKAVETELDQCWDLLRQRRAKREFGEDPESAQARSADTVEGYLN
jgi:Protein of unknown function (DUF2630)